MKTTRSGSKKQSKLINKSFRQTHKDHSFLIDDAPKRNKAIKI